MVDEELARKLFCQPCEFIRGVTEMGHLLPPTISEFAFIGRSNVGKSSLINALTGRKTLARTSNTPGRTQQLNFFDLGHKLMLVDLPGYGYAKVGRTQVEQWQVLIRAYLSGRASLRRVYVLVDARHGLKPSDQKMMEMLDNHAVSYQLVLTKSDKVKPPALIKLVTGLQEQVKAHAALHPHVIATSAEKRRGIAELQMAIMEVMW